MSTNLTKPGAEKKQTGPVPLAVDLDGTLTRIDTLHESLLLLVARHPVRLLQLPGWLKSGKAGFKRRVAEEVVASAETLPLNDEVVAFVREAQADGRPVILVSAADQKQVDAVAAETGLFDEAVGSDGTRNLKGQAKADWLVDRFGAGGFDYVGDSRADLLIWPAARRVITVGAAPRLRRTVEALDVGALHLDPPSRDRLVAHFKAMRPHQWLKNLLVFLPALAGHAPGALPSSTAGFVAFCLAASAIYLINDMLDLDVDRRHLRKRHRPFAAGTLPVSHGVVQAVGLLAAAGLVGIFAGPAFLAVLAGYIVLTTVYSMWLKRQLMVDIWLLAGLYTVRIIAGSAASGVPLSEWLLAFSMFLFLALAAVKRQSELADLASRGLEQSDGRGYRVSDLPVVLGVTLAAGYCSVLVLALYISSDSVLALYSEPRLLWLVCPLLLYWISRAAIVSWRGRMDDDPIVFAIKDPVSLAIFAIAAALFLLGTIL